MRSVRHGPLLLLGLLTLGGLGGRARAQDSGIQIAIEEPVSGLHLDVAGGCQVRPASTEGSACQSFAASADKSDLFAVVLRPNGLLLYSVGVFVAREAGAGETRARRIAEGLGKASVGTPALVRYGAQDFLRTQLHLEQGEATCFVTVDERPEVAIVTFATDPASKERMDAASEAVMRSVRRSGAPAPAPPSRVTPLLLSSLFVLVVGLPVVTVIVRTVRARRRERERR